MTKIFSAAALIVSLLSIPASAADAKACDEFVAAFQKGAKAGGQTLSEDDLPFWKKQCLKKPDAEVKKDTACLNKVKNEADLKGCMK